MYRDWKRFGGSLLLPVGPFAGYTPSAVSSLSNGQLVSGASFSGNTVLTPARYKTLTIGDCRLSSDSDSLVYAAWANTINFSGVGTFDLSGYDGTNGIQPCGVEGGNGGNWSGGGGAAFFPAGCSCGCIILVGGNAGVEISHGSVEAGANGSAMSPCCSAANPGIGGSGAGTISTTQSNSWAFQNGFNGGSLTFTNGSPGIKLIGGAGAGGSISGAFFSPVGAGGGGGRGGGAVFVSRFTTGDGSVGVQSNGGNGGGASDGCVGAEGGAPGGGGAIDYLTKNYIAGSIAFVVGANFRLFEIRADNTVNMTPRGTGDSWANG